MFFMSWMVGGALSSSGESVASAPDPTVEWRIPRLSAPPVADGRMDGREWEDALRIEKFADERGHVPATPKTRVLVGWTPQALCFAFVCEGRAEYLKGDPAKTDSLVYEGDSVELFLSTRPVPQSYMEVVANAAGARLDLLHAWLAGPLRPESPWQTLPRIMAVAWNSPAIHIGASQTSHGWGVEMVVDNSVLWDVEHEACTQTGKAVPAEFAAGRICRANFIRLSYPAGDGGKRTRHLQSAAPVPGGEPPLTPYCFGRLVLMEKKKK